MTLGLAYSSNRCGAARKMAHEKVRQRRGAGRRENVLTKPVSAVF